MYFLIKCLQFLIKYINLHYLTNVFFKSDSDGNVAYFVIG